MFNVGGGELLVILLIALIVLGPQRLPDAARQVGRVVSEVRRVSSGFQRELKDAFDATEVEATPRREEATPLAATVAEAEGASGASPPARDVGGAAGEGDSSADEPAVAPAVAAALDEIVTPLDPATDQHADAPAGASADGPDTPGVGDERAAS
jgi:Tat protein translocase TatB subunit